MGVYMCIVCQDLQQSNFFNDELKDSQIDALEVGIAKHFLYIHVHVFICVYSVYTTYICTYT